MGMTWFAEAPSNIALIKYMGKKDEEKNTPLNSSLSMTLSQLLTYVEIEKKDEESEEDSWSLIKKENLPSFHLSEKGKKRYLDHFKFLKKEFEIKGSYFIRSRNNFPANCGLASSASSFAALTLCAHKMNEKSRDIAFYSQKGSGSSCRSFFKPWALWDEEGVRSIDLPLLDHFVVIVEDKTKEVSSSEAHLRVKTSPFFEGRSERAEKRIERLIKTFKEKNWQESYKIVWDEFCDMHNLFETSSIPFSYRSEKTLSVLKTVRDYWEKEKDGPLVTLDAGPNIHFLFRKDQKDIFSYFKKKFSPTV